LHDANVLHDRRYTAHFSVENELPDLISDEETILDGNILTSRGAGTAIPFALEIIRVLCSEDAAQKVAASICYFGRKSHG
jgi:4-methyl-5(b-hydroxyethyl)-thiazole monophosphate biosynthesis